jgi:hypothetical protein
MGCENHEFRQYYGETQYILLGSKSGEEIPKTPLGMRNEIAKICSASAEPLIREFKVLNSIRNLINQSIYLRSIQFLAYDTYKKSADVANGQDANTFNEVVVNSQNSSPQKMYAHSNFINGMLPINFLDNHFRPQLFINNKNILKNITGYDEDGNANSIIGIPHNFCWELNQHCDKFTGIKGSSAFAQYIPEELKYQNYYVLAILEIWLNDKEII